ncbi:HEAT repeat domain-containing protein [Empedobacter sedimenti]|uniref:HEAT repeat domain-containing protein n=1 Tax=Empedobacter sedimenti TaxID=3042610 RepID=UPI0024A73F58|nr:HEAT repeat domain-containing protein [Empedobacter sedimenti]
MNDPLKKYIDNNREAFENKEPSAELWKKIQANIPQQTKVLETPKRSITTYWSIAASALVVVSAGLYFVLNQHSDQNLNVNQQEIVKKSVQVKPEAIKENPVIFEKSSEEFKNNETIVASRIKESKNSKQNDLNTNQIITDNVKEDVLLALNDEQSTSNRIDAIAKLGEYEALNRNDLDALKQKALNDNNTIVRLNAIEVLAKKTPKSTVSEELTNVFLQQDDPMVQMELIGIIGKMDNNKTVPQLTKKLQEMVLDPQTMPFVKDEAYAVLLKNNVSQ